jgi:hypothetical protein
MMEAVSTSETHVNFYQTTWRNIPEVSHRHTRRRENLKSSSSLHGLGESPVSVSSIVVSVSIVFLVYLCHVFQMVDIRL